MRTRTPFCTLITRSQVVALVVALAVLAGCSRGPSPSEIEDKTEPPPIAPVVSGDAEAPSQKRIPEAAEKARQTRIPETAEKTPTVAIKPDRDITTVDLPSPIDDVCVAAGGERLIVRLRNLAKLAVLDVKAAKIVGYITLDDPLDVFAAGAERLFVIGRRSRLIMQYKLSDLTPVIHERSIPGDSSIVAAGMGASSRGPLVVACSNDLFGAIVVFDPDADEVALAQRMRGQGSGALGRVSASADGSVFCISNCLQLSSHEALRWSIRDTQFGHCLLTTPGQYALPDDIGEWVYVGTWRCDGNGVRNDLGGLPAGFDCIPAIGGPYCLAIPVADPSRARRGNAAPPELALPDSQCVRVCLLGEPRPALSIPVCAFSLLRSQEGIPRVDRGTIARRLFLLPRANIIAELPISKNCVVLHHVNLQEESRRAFPNELLVVSQPPRRVRAGETLRYRIETQSRSGRPTFHLDTGPKGMTVSEGGLIEWAAPLGLAYNNVGAVVSISDSGSTKFHSLAIAVEPPEDILASAETGPPPNICANGLPAANLRLKLPAAWEDVCVGGDGQVLVLTLPSMHRAAIFDVPAAKIVGYIPLRDHCLVAAGIDRFVEVDPQQSMIRQYDLKTQKLLSERPLAVRGRPALIALGSASTGPLLIGLGEGNRNLEHIVLLDLNTPERSGQEEQRTRVLLNVTARAWASADGQVFGIVGGDQGMLLTYADKKIAKESAPYASIWMIPDETGDHIHTAGGIHGDRFMEPDRANPNLAARERYIPAVRGPLYLKLQPHPTGVSAGLGVLGEEAPLASLPAFPFSDPPLVNRTSRIQIGLDKRIYLIPNAHCIAWLPEGQEQIVLTRFNLDETLERSGANYLAVVSRPPRVAPPGEMFEYQLDVRSKAGKVAYRLDVGPEGMEISPAGLVRWKARYTPQHDTASVVITVTDGSGRSTRHEFGLMSHKAPVAPTEQATPPNVGSKRPPVAPARPFGASATGAPLPPTRVAGKPEEWKLTKVNERRLDMSGDDVYLTPGLNHKSLLLLQGDRLAVLSPSGTSITKVVHLGASYKRIAQRADYYVAIRQDVAGIDLIDKTTLSTTRHITFENRYPLEFALHPTLPISYVTVLPQGVTGNRFGAIVLLNETTGEIRESPDWLGEWVQIDAAGQRLTSAGHFSREAGSELLIAPRPNPAMPHVPRGPYGPGGAANVRVYSRVETVDAVLVYDLGEDGSPLRSECCFERPANRCGMRMAPDGLRAALLHKIGTCEAFDLDALQEKPIEYAMNSKATVDLAFHPVLPLVACLSSDTPAIFHRETGVLQPKSLKYPAADLEGATLRHAWFSADGRGLLVDMNDASGNHCLYRAELDLSSADLAKIEQRLSNMASLGRNLVFDRALKPGCGAVPLAAIDAFRGGRRQAMSPQEIGRLFTDAVVVVRSGQRSGTGFVVGKSGYVLTCAHGIREADGVSVSFRSKNDGNNIEPKTVPAKVACIDRGQDLTLLKVEGMSALPTVSLAIGNTVESGERVTIIGNPGVGQAVLDYTMTEGIVSNVRRRFGHHVLLQTSAAVNPGSSGAPMFSSNGSVIGLVVLKASIEGAGFAVPASELATFLAAAVKATGPEAGIERQWLDSSGQHEVAAKYLGVRNKAVQLQRGDGTEIAVPLTQLSRQDVAFVRLLCPDAVGAPSDGSQKE